jgi:hypothetical protein
LIQLKGHKKSSYSRVSRLHDEALDVQAQSISLCAFVPSLRTSVILDFLSNNFDS